MVKEHYENLLAIAEDAFNQIENTFEPGSEKSFYLAALVYYLDGYISKNYPKLHPAFEEHFKTEFKKHKGLMDLISLKSA